MLVFINCVLLSCR